MSNAFANVSTAAVSIKEVEAEFQDLFFKDSDSTECPFDRMVAQSKFTAAAAKTETKKVTEWIKNSCSLIELKKGKNFNYFTVPEPIQCTFNDVVSCCYFFFFVKTLLTHHYTL
jgi:hypothetical protein